MKEIKEEEFEAEVLSAPSSVVEFYTPSCGHCKVLQRTIEAIEGEYPEVGFYSVNAEVEIDLAQKYEVQAVPVLFFIKEGNILERTLGEKHPESIRNNIKKIQ